MFMFYTHSYFPLHISHVNPMLFILTYSHITIYICVCGCGRKKRHQSGSLLPPTAKQSLGTFAMALCSWLLSACVVAPISWEKLYIPLKTRFGLSIDLHICNVKKVKYNTIFDQVLLTCIAILHSLERQTRDHQMVTYRRWEGQSHLLEDPHRAACRGRDRNKQVVFSAGQTQPEGVRNQVTFHKVSTKHKLKF